MIKEYLINFGFNENDYNKIINTYSLIGYIEDTLYKKLVEVTNHLIFLGYSKETIIKIGRTLPQIFTLSVTNIDNQISDMKDLGYSKEEILKMTKATPKIYSYKIDSIRQKIKDLMDLGYTKEDTLKMTVAASQLFNTSITKNIQKSFIDIMKLGYTKEDVLKMGRNLPSLFCLDINTIKQKLENIINLGYTYEEALNITKSFSTLYGYSTDNVKEKIEFYDSVNLHDLAITSPAYLMQSVTLSYARYTYFQKEKNLLIDMTNYTQMFLGEKTFKRKNGYTNNELIEKYNYDEYVRTLKNGRVI